MARPQRISWFPLSTLLCGALLVFPPSAVAEALSMELKDLGQGMYRLEGHFAVRSSRSDVWGVLTDYNHIDHFVSSLRRSEVKEAVPGRVLLEQVALGRVLIFSRHIRVLLEVNEEPFSRIRF